MVRGKNPNIGGIRISGKGHTVRSIKSIGYDQGIDIEGDDHDIEDALAIAPASEPSPEPPKPSFWIHPITKTILYIVGVVAAAALILFFGLK